MKKGLIIFLSIFGGLVVIGGLVAICLTTGLLGNLFGLKGKSYTAIWKNYDGTVLYTEENVERDAEHIYKGPTPTSDEDDMCIYEFSGWNRELETETVVSKDGSVGRTYTGNIIYTATYRAIEKRYYIYLDTNGDVIETYVGTVNDASSAKYKGDYIPTKESDDPGISYEFRGWNKELDGNTFYYTPRFNTIYATYTVTYQNEDGTVLKTLQAHYLDKISTIKYTGTTPTKEDEGVYHYTFDGWVMNYESDKVLRDTIFTATFTEELTGYQISFDLDGGVTSSSTDPIIVQSLNRSNFFFNLSKDTYRFCGWSYNGVQVFDENGEIINYIELEPQMTFKAIFLQKAKITVVYEIRTPNELIVSYHNLNPKYGTASGTALYDYNSTVNLTANLIDGLTFLGWYTNTNALISNNANCSYEVATSDTTIECRFEYTAHTLTVATSNEAAGLVNVAKHEANVKQTQVNNRYSEEMTLSTSPLTEAEFLGWFDTSSGERLSTEPEYTFAMPNRDLSIIAKWDYYTVKYDLDGGINHANNITHYTSKDTSFTLLSPTREGYTFLGWKMNGQAVEVIDPTTLINYDLTAYWTYYTVSTFINHPSLGNYTMLDGELVTCGESVTLTAQCINNSTFSGWYLDGNLVTEELSYTFEMTAVNQKYEARFVIPEGFENLLFNVIDDNITVIGVIDRSVTSIVVPDSVTTILEGSFSGCSNLEYLSVPFIGKKLHLAHEGRPYSDEFVLGYVFGQNSYTNSVGVLQTHLSGLGEETSETYQLPQSLATVVLRSGNQIYYNAFENCSMIENIYIPDTITLINSFAFRGCTSLSSIEFPSGLTTIENNAFLMCTTLEEVNIPASVNKIENNAFWGCSSLTILHYANEDATLGIGVFSGTHIESAYISPNVASVMERSYLVDLTINGATINANAFSSCSHLETVTFIGVTTIGNSAFFSCNALQKVTINSLEAWCNIAFGNANSNPLFYAHDLYVGDELAVNASIPDTITRINSHAFTGSSIKSLFIPNSVTEIGLNILAYCTNIETLSVPFIGYERGTVENTSSHRNLGFFFNTANYGNTQQYTASNTYNWILYDIPETLTTVYVTDTTFIPAYAFQNCNNIQRVTLCDSVTSIGSSAFEECWSMMHFAVPASLTTIGEDAFCGCIRLVELYNKSSLSFTMGSTNKGSIAYYVENIITNIENSKLSTSEDGFVTYDGEILINYIGKEANISAPDTITELRDYAFYNNKVVKNVVLPDSILNMGTYVFNGCSNLESVNLPSDLEEIPDYTFNLCENLTHIYNLLNITTIGNNALAYVNIETISFNKALCSIGDGAFACAKTKTIYYSGTTAEWNAIHKSANWNNASYISRIICSNDDIYI